MLRVSSGIAKSIKQQCLLQSFMRFSSKAKAASAEAQLPEPLTNPSILYTGVWYLFFIYYNANHKMRTLFVIQFQNYCFIFIIKL